jgi:hypothetical protein
MRRYSYVGPDDIRAAAIGERPGTPIESRDDLACWLVDHAREREGETIPATFVVTLDGVLRLANRRSEHVACASGGQVIAAGELFISPDGSVIEASNQSTGFCPEPTCWDALASALDRAGVPRPQRLTRPFVFRRCPGCGERNIVKDDFYECAFCDTALPREWNFA